MAFEDFNAAKVGKTSRDVPLGCYIGDLQCLLGPPTAKNNSVPF